MSRPVRDRTTATQTTPAPTEALLLVATARYPSAVKVAQRFPEMASLVFDGVEGSLVDQFLTGSVAGEDAEIVVSVGNDEIAHPRNLQSHWVFENRVLHSGSTNLRQEFGPNGRLL